jgi:hypothetical protein
MRFKYLSATPNYVPDLLSAKICEAVQWNSSYIVSQANTERSEQNQRQSSVSSHKAGWQQHIRGEVVECSVRLRTACWLQFCVRKLNNLSTVTKWLALQFRETFLLHKLSVLIITNFNYLCIYYILVTEINPQCKDSRKKFQLVQFKS